MTSVCPPETARVFFALWPEAALRGSLYALAQAWRQRCGGRIVRRENLHLTLAFVGKVDTLQFAVLKDIVARQVVRPFDLALNAGAHFKHNRIASAQPVPLPAVLADLVAGLESSLRSGAVAYDARPYVPHVSWVRDARRAPPPVIEPPLAWRVDALCLVRSQPGVAGVTYSVVARSQSA